MTTTMNTITTDNDQVRSWLQAQIKGCLQRYGAQEPLYPVIQRALAEREELEPLTDDKREQVREALELLRNTDWKLGQRQWEEAQSYLTEAHNKLQTARVAINSGTWRRELYLEITELAESIEYTMLMPGDSAWTAWRGDKGCSILTLQPYYQAAGLIEVLQAWQRGADLTIVDGELTAYIDDDED